MLIQVTHANPSHANPSHANPSQCEKGAVTQVRINSVTVVRKKFSKVYGVFRALYSSSRLFLTYLCFYGADNVHQT